jgi:hypothetical protein
LIGPLPDPSLGCPSNQWAWVHPIVCDELKWINSCKCKFEYYSEGIGNFMREFWQCEIRSIESKLFQKGPYLWVGWNYLFQKGPYLWVGWNYFKRLLLVSRLELFISKGSVSVSRLELFQKVLTRGSVEIIGVILVASLINANFKFVNLSAYNNCR